VVLIEVGVGKVPEPKNLDIPLIPVIQVKLALRTTLAVAVGVPGMGQYVMQAYDVAAVGAVDEQLLGVAKVPSPPAALVARPAIAVSP